MPRLCVARDLLLCLLLSSVRLHGFVRGDDALVTLEDVNVEQNADPARKIRLHKVVVVLIDLCQNVPLTGLMELVLHSLDNLAHNEVLVHEYKEETFEECIEAEESERWNRDEDLGDEFAEELSLVENVLVELCQFLQHVDIRTRLGKCILPENFRDLGPLVRRTGNAAKVDKRGQVLRLWWILMLDESEVEALLVEDIDELLRHLDEGEHDSLLLSKTAFEVVILQHMPQLVSDQSLSHQARHARLNFGKLLFIIEHVSLAHSGREAVLLKHLDLVKLNELEQVELGPGWRQIHILKVCSALLFGFEIALLLGFQQLFRICEEVVDQGCASLRCQWQEVAVRILQPRFPAASHLAVIVVYIRLVVRVIHLVDQVRRVVKVVEAVVKCRERFRGREV